MISSLSRGEGSYSMAPLSYLCFLLLTPTPGVTATSEGLAVRQFPPALNVMRGETATLSCHFKVPSLKYGVQWFKMKSEKTLIPNSARQIIAERNQTSSLEITEVALEDGGMYYCEVNVLQKDPERGNGTEIIVLAPPSAPRMLLQIPRDPETGQWALLCVTGGFHPNDLTLTWSYQTVADIDHPSDRNCTFPSSSPLVDLSTSPIPGPPTSGRSADSVFGSASQRQPKCFLVTDHFGQELHLISVFLLPAKQSLDTGITYTCTVQDHPALTTAISATFTWEASPHELIGYLNIVKMCLISGMTMVFLLEALKRLLFVWKKRPRQGNKT